MQLSFTTEQEAFRLEVRAFVKAHLPADIRRKVAMGLRLEHVDYVTWFRILQARGWLTPGWPVAHGGPGWDHVQRYIFDEETLLGGAPRIIASGIQMLAPVLLAFGTEAQKQQYLPGILNSNTWWAQGFSEPGAGSDLAALKTRGRIDGDHLVVNGGVIACGFGDARDADAVAILAEQYPGRRVVTVDARPLFARGGGIHCITQHQPSAR